MQEEHGVTWAENIRDVTLWLWSWMKYVVLLTAMYIPPYVYGLNLWIITASILLLGLIGYGIGSIFPKDAPSIYLFKVDLNNATIQMLRGAYKNEGGNEMVYIKGAWKEIRYEGRNVASPFWMNGGYPVHLIEDFTDTSSYVRIKEATLHSYSAIAIAMLKDVLPQLAIEHMKALQDKAGYEEAGYNFLTTLGQKLQNATLRELPSPQELLKYLKSEMVSKEMQTDNYDNDNLNDNQSDNLNNGSIDNNIGD